MLHFEGEQKKFTLAAGSGTRGVIGIGIIGAGNISDLHSHGYLGNPKASIVAVADVRGEIAEEKRKKFGAARSYSDYKELLRDKEVDAVDICLPNFLHAQAAIDGAEAGKHVLVEKPMATTVRDCDEMISAARRSGVKLMVAHNQVFYPPHQEAKRLIDSSEIGTPIIVLARLHNGMRQSFGWRADAKSVGGGFLMEAGIHRLYLSRYLFGEPRRIYCWLSKLFEDTINEDIVQIIIDFENKRQGSIIANQGGPFPIWDDRTEVVGTEGLIIVNGFEEQAIAGPPLMFYKNGRWSNYVRAGHPATIGDYPLGNLEIEADFFKTYANEVSHFIECIYEDKTPMVTGEDGKKVIEMVAACYESATAQKPIVLS